MRALFIHYKTGITKASQVATPSTVFVFLFFSPQQFVLSFNNLFLISHLSSHSHCHQIFFCSLALELIVFQVTDLYS